MDVKRLGVTLSIAGLCLGIQFACVTVPRDPEGTLNRVLRTHTIRIGVVEDPPWIVRTTGEPAGIAVNIAREFAQSVSATPQWFWGGQGEMMKALKTFNLDMVIADVDAKTPWSKDIGVSQPYVMERFVIGVPSGRQIPANLKGITVGYLDDDLAGAYLAKKGAIAEAVHNVANTAGPLAAPSWRLKQLGYTITPIHLFQEQRVIAVPPGENGWLNRLDKFLAQHKSEIMNTLEHGEAAP